MTFYSNIIILTELLMLAMILHVSRYSGFKKTQKLWFILTFASISYCAAAEFLVHSGSYIPQLKLLYVIITISQFSIAPLLCVFFVGALGLYNNYKYVSCFFMLHAILEIIAAPFGWIFYFDDNGYSRGNLFFIYTIFYVISLIYLIYGMLKVGKMFKHRDRLTIVMILVLLVAGIVPMTFFEIHVTYLSIAMSASICYIYYNDLIQQDVKDELVSNQKKLNQIQEHMIYGLANLIENRDLETGEHIIRTRQYVKLISENARKEGIYTDILTDDYISMLKMLSPLHDIGKIVISDTILKKPGKLTKEEFEEMKKHASVGGVVIKEVFNGITDENYIKFASDIATYHHERWDGTGYPQGLKTDEIPLSARIMAIADVFDALISERCYKKAFSKEEAFKIIEEESGSHFDPKLVKVFLDHKEEIININ